MSLGRIHRLDRVSALAVALFMMTGGPQPRDLAYAAAPSNPPLFYSDRPDAAAFRAMCEAELANAQEALDRILAVKGPRTIENTLVPYNEMTLHADNAVYQGELMESVHPDSTFRNAAEEVKQKARNFLSEATVNRRLYDALKAADVKKADPDTKFLVERTLRDFRLAGVDQDEPTRKKIAALRDELVKIGQEFDRNIRNDSRTIKLDSASDLDGLPEDFIRSHPPGEDGRITISIEFPDRVPVMKYAKKEDVRRRLYMERVNRAYPQNMPVLDRMVATRHELATLIGYKTWADLVTADKMIQNPKRIAEFLERVGGLVTDQSKREYALLLKRKREDAPQATALQNWESSYYSNLIRKRDFDFDAQSVRPYFPFRQVQQGVLDVTSRIFGVQFKRIENAVVWHPSVEAYEVWEGDRLIGRFFLDLHQRAGKYNHAAEFTIRQGCTGIQIPEAALVCNLPGDKADDPGLMEHSDVTTFFHEFGHLLHTIFAGGQRWEPLAGTATEWDFVEAPSQMLEEWAWYPSSLQSFAKHYKTGEAIPAAMVEKMRRAAAFGRGVDYAYQTYLSNISLHLYDRPPASVNSDSIVVQTERALLPFPAVPNSHMQCSFGHLDGYSAIYYTYTWSLVIAKDMFSQFDREHLLDPSTPSRYRKAVLAPGGTRPAEKLVRDFLRRDFQYKAFEEYLREGVN